MAVTYNLSAQNGAFTATISQDAALNWSWTLTPSGQSAYSGPFSVFAFTSQFQINADVLYTFTKGTQQPDGSYTGQVEYPSPSHIVTNWTAQKKTAHKHEAA
jgi:hypothetical protein